MAPSIILATNFNWFSSVISWSTLGLVLIAIGIFATLLSSHRYLLAYLLGGMGYWLVVEGIQSVVASTFTIDIWHSYVASLAITWFVPSLVLAYRYSRTPTHSGGAKGMKLKRGSKPLAHSDNYIEHTPIYNNYKPRFHN